MKKVFQEYGTFLLTVTISLLVFTIVFFSLPGKDGTRGLLNVLGGELQDEKRKEQTEELKKYMERKRPNISYRYSEILYAKKEYLITELFQGKSEEGNDTKVSLIGVGKIEDKLEECRKDHVVFPEKGIYVLIVETKDSYGKKTLEKFEIPVMERWGKEEK